MSPIDTHEEPWLRDALGSLLVDEPPMSPVAVVDDVRRGAVAVAAVKRRRSASLAIAAVVLAVAVPVGLLVRAAPDASAPPATSQSPFPTASASIPPVIDGALAGTGWRVINGPQPLDSSPSYAYLIQPVDGSDTPSANVIVYVAQQRTPGPYLAACTSTTCPGERSKVFADGATASDGYEEDGATAADGMLVPKGSLIVDRAYGTGTLVEVVVTSAWTNAGDPRTQATSRSVLTLDQTQRILNVIADPFHPTGNPDAAAARFVPDPEWVDEVVAAMPSTATALDGGGLESRSVSARVSLRLVRDGVGTFARVTIDSAAEGGSSPLEDSPCVDTAGGARCTVDQPWVTGAIQGATVETSVHEVAYPPDFPGSGFSGAYSTRSVMVVRGDTVLTILSDSRDVDGSGSWTSSSAPLSTEELLSLSRTMPLPDMMRPFFAKPLWGVSEFTPRGPVADAPVDIPGCAGDMTRPASQQTCLDAVGTALAQRSLYYAGGSAMTLASVDPAVEDVAVWFQAHVTSAASGFQRVSAAGPHPGTSRAPVVTSWNIGPSKATYYACMTGTAISVGTLPCVRS